MNVSPTNLLLSKRALACGRYQLNAVGTDDDLRVACVAVHRNHLANNPTQNKFRG
jgi:hypothetical protein